MSLDVVEVSDDRDRRMAVSHPPGTRCRYHIDGWLALAPDRLLHMHEGAARKRIVVDE